MVEITNFPGLSKFDGSERGHVVVGGNSRGFDVSQLRLFLADSNGDWRDGCRVATTANVDLSADLEAGDTIDGVVLVTGDRVLVKSQTTASENGIYPAVASGAATRATDLDVQAEVLNGAVLYIFEGTANARKAYIVTSQDPHSVDIDDIAFGEHSPALGGAIEALQNGSTVVAAATTLDAISGITFTDLGGNKVGVSAAGGVGGLGEASGVWADYAGANIVQNGQYLEFDLPGGEDDILLSFHGWYWAAAITGDFLTIQAYESGAWQDVASYWSYSRKGWDSGGNTNDAGGGLLNFAPVHGDLTGFDTVDGALSGEIRLTFHDTVLQCQGTIVGNGSRSGFSAATIGATVAPTKIRFFSSQGGVAQGLNWAAELVVTSRLQTRQVIGGGNGTELKYCIAGTDGTSTGLNFSTTSAVPWNAESDDVNGWHDIVTNNSRITPSGIPDGFVDVHADVNLNGVTADEWVFVRLYKNGAEYSRGSGQEVGVTSHGSLLFWPMVPYVQGDYFEIFSNLQSDTSVTLADPSRFMVKQSVLSTGASAKKYCIAGATAQTSLDIVVSQGAIWDADLDDPYDWHDPVTNNTRITPTGIAGGYVDISCNVRLNAMTSGDYFYVYLYKNGSQVLTPASNEPQVQSPAITSTWDMVEFTEGDYFELFIQVQSDTSVNYFNAENRFVIRESR